MRREIYIRGVETYGGGVVLFFAEQIARATQTAHGGESTSSRETLELRTEKC